MNEDGPGESSKQTGRHMKKPVCRMSPARIQACPADQVQQIGDDGAPVCQKRACTVRPSTEAPYRAGTCRLLGKACMTRAVAGQASARLSVQCTDKVCQHSDVSVRLSVRHTRYCVEQNERMIIQSSPSGTTAIVFF